MFSIADKYETLVPQTNSVKKANCFTCRENRLLMLVMWTDCLDTI